MIAQRRNILLTLRLLASGLVFLLGCATSSHWKIKGYVSDPDGNSIRHARINLAGQGFDKTIFSKWNGRFEAKRIKVVRGYSLSVDVPGFTPLRVARMFPYTCNLRLYLSPDIPLPESCSGTGRIMGIVTEDTGEPIPGVGVWLEGTSYGVACGIDGKYLITNIPIGKYTITAAVVGYYRNVYKSITVLPDSLLTIDFELVSQPIASITISDLKDALPIKDRYFTSMNGS